MFELVESSTSSKHKLSFGKLACVAHVFVFLFTSFYSKHDFSHMPSSIVNFPFFGSENRQQMALQHLLLGLLFFYICFQMRCETIFFWTIDTSNPWKITNSPSHFTPWRNMPYNSEPQWSQNVGDMKVYGRNRWGKSILNLSLKYWNRKTCQS